MKAKTRSAAEDSLSSLSEQWTRKEFKPVYFFSGADMFQKEDALKLFEKSFLAGDTSGLNVDRFDGTSAKATAIINAAGTLPFLGGNRLILVRRTHELAAAEVHHLADHLSSVASGNCVVFFWDEKAEASNKLMQAARSVGSVVTFWVPFENQLPRWIQQRAETLGKPMGTEAARLCLETVGPNLSDLNQEIEKLVLYVKDRKSIEPKDVEALRPESRTLQFYEWDRAFWKKDRRKALDILEMQRAQGQRPEALLSQIVRVYRRLLSGKAMFSEKKLPTEVVFKILRIGSFDTRREYEQAMQDFSWKDLMDDLEKIARTERDLKTGRVEEEAGLTLLICRLTEA